MTLSRIPQTKQVSSSARVEELFTEKGLAEKALVRCEKGLASLEAYVSSINVQHTDVADLDMVIEHYDKAAEKLDKRIVDLEKTIKKISEDIEKERAELEGSTMDDKLSLRAAIGVFAAAEGQVEIALIYGMWFVLTVSVQLQTQVWNSCEWSNMEGPVRYPGGHADEGETREVDLQGCNNPGHGGGSFPFLASHHESTVNVSLLGMGRRSVEFGNGFTDLWCRVVAAAALDYLDLYAPGKGKEIESVWDFVGTGC